MSNLGDDWDEEPLPPDVRALSATLSDAADPGCLVRVAAAASAELHEGNDSAVAVLRWPSAAQAVAQPLSRCRQPLVLEACRRHGMSFEEYAAKLGVTRAALVLILKGHDPVPRHMLDSIRHFTGEAQQGAAA